MSLESNTLALGASITDADLEDLEDLDDLVDVVGLLEFSSSLRFCRLFSKTAPCQ